jgi:dUTPase
LVYFQLHEDSTFLPKICENSNGLDLPLQTDTYFQPFEVKPINLGIKFQLPKDYCALIMNKSSARLKYNVQVQLGLIDFLFHDYVICVVQNMQSSPLVLTKGMAVAQLLVLFNPIPIFQREWPETNSTRGGFGSTGQNFETVNMK